MIVVVGDVAKLATETLQFSLRCVLFDFVLPSNLQNVLKVVKRTFESNTLTLSKSAREDPMLSAGTFSMSEEFGELERLGECGAILDEY